MVFVSELVNYEGMIDKTTWETFTKVLAPFAPFISEEMWRQMGNTTSVHLTEWPNTDEKYIDQSSIKIAVQVNGRLRGTIEVSQESSKEDVEQQVRENPQFIKYLAGETKDVIFISGKVINFVTE